MEGRSIMEGWRKGGKEGWRDRGMKGIWRDGEMGMEGDGEMEGWRRYGGMEIEGGGGVKRTGRRKDGGLRD